MSFVLTSEKTGIVLGTYEATAPCVKLEQGKPRAGMKRPLDLAPGEQTIIDYPLDGSAPRTLTCSVRRVADAGTSEERLSPVPSRPRVVEIEQPRRNVRPAIPGEWTDTPIAPKPLAKVDAPPVSATRRRVVRKTP